MHPIEVTPMFQYNTSVSTTMVKKSQRENIALLKLTDTVFILGLCPSSEFFNKHDVLFPFIGKEAPNLT